MNTANHGLRAAESFRTPVATRLAALAAELDATGEGPEHLARAVALAELIGAPEVVAALGDGAAALRGLAPDLPRALEAGAEVAEAVLRAVAATMDAAARYEGAQPWAEFAILDACTANGDELERVSAGVMLAPAAVWAHLDARGLAPACGGDWWADPYAGAIESAAGA